jgi:hypothetical protein
MNHRDLERRLYSVKTNMGKLEGFYGGHGKFSESHLVEPFLLHRGDSFWHSS